MSKYRLDVNGDKGVMVLSGELGIEDAANLKQAFSEALEKHSELSVDLTGVESCHISVLQILIAVHAGMKARGAELGQEGEIPEPVVETSKEAGLLIGMQDACFWRRG
jgi:anti-anti-sigma regulatory factor